jgi:hypothetical protein
MERAGIETELYLAMKWLWRKNLHGEAPERTGPDSG